MRAAVIALGCLFACSDPAPMPDAAATPDTQSGLCTGQRYDACNPAAPNCVAGTTCYTIPDLGMSVCTVVCSLNFGCSDGNYATCTNTHVTMPASGSICIPPMTNPGCVAPP